MQRASETDIEAAKEYLIERLSAERSMQSNLEHVMKMAAERIVEIVYSEKIAPAVVSYEKMPPAIRMRIDEVVDWLRDTIDDYFLTLAIADHEGTRDQILPLILGKSHGMTFNERLTDYVNKYRNELLLLIGAGLFLGISKNVLAKSIGDNLKHPYANQLLADGIDNGISFGRGKYNSMLNNINRLCCFGISTAWMENQYMSDKSKDCIGWLVQRGSSYPCGLCDEKVGYQTEDSNLPPFHANCKCYAVPIFL